MFPVPARGKNTNSMASWCSAHQGPIVPAQGSIFPMDKGKKSDADSRISLIPTRYSQMRSVDELGGERPSLRLSRALGRFPTVTDGEWEAAIDGMRPYRGGSCDGRVTIADIDSRAVVSRMRGREKTQAHPIFLPRHAESIVLPKVRRKIGVVLSSCSERALCWYGLSPWWRTRKFW